MNGHQILAVLELILYAALLVPATFCTFYYLFNKKQTAWLYLHAFVIGTITMRPLQPISPSILY
jgi:hypothetical protein